VGRGLGAMGWAGLGSSFPHVVLTGAQTDGHSKRPVADREVRSS
jgi:hypothetical protein